MCEDGVGVVRRVRGVDARGEDGETRREGGRGEAATATVDEATKSGEYARAVDAVREMLAMEIAEDDDEEDRRRAVEMREAVAKRLRDSVEKELRLAVDAAEDGTRASIDGARIARACAHLGELSEHETRDRMAGVSATLVDRVLTRVVEEGARVDVDADGALRVRFGDAPTTADDPHGAHEAFETCLRWIRDEFPNDDVAEAFGANAWERLAETCVRAWLSITPPNGRLIARAPWRKSPRCVRSSHRRRTALRRTRAGRWDRSRPRRSPRRCARRRNVARASSSARERSR